MEFRTTRRIDAPIERTWQVWMDAARYPQWQGGVLSVRDISGPIDRAGTTYVLDHGPKMKRTVRVVDVEAPVRHVIEQSGFGVHDLTTVTFEPEGTGTRLTVTIHMQFNRVMKVLARLDRRSRMEGEVDREIERFAKVVSRLPGPTRPGGVHVVRAGGYGRRLTVVASDDDVVHVRMHAGHLREDDLATADLRQPKPMSDQLQLDPIPPPIRGGGLVARGLPVLLRDGGHGVQHLALSMDAWADAEGRDLGIDDPVTPEDDAAVAAWRADDGPTVGRDPELDFAPLCTIRIGERPTGEEAWAVAKVLRSEILRVHLAVYGPWAAARHEMVVPYELRLRPMDEEAIAAGTMPDPQQGVGHLALSRSALAEVQARFAGVTTVTRDELEGYRIWREAKGGAFDSLRWMLDWPGDAVQITLPPDQAVND